MVFVKAQACSAGGAGRMGRRQRVCICVYVRMSRGWTSAAVVLRRQAEEGPVVLPEGPVRVGRAPGSAADRVPWQRVQGPAEGLESRVEAQRVSGAPAGNGKHPGFELSTLKLLVGLPTSVFFFFWNSVSVFYFLIYFFGIIILCTKVLLKMVFFLRY